MLGAVGLGDPDATPPVGGEAGEVGPVGTGEFVVEPSEGDEEGAGTTMIGPPVVQVDGDVYTPLTGLDPLQSEPVL